MLMNESKEARAYALTKRARETLSVRLRREDLSEVEAALQLLIQAVEALTEHVAPLLTFGGYDSETIERLFGKITEGVKLPALALDQFDRTESQPRDNPSSARSFIISFPDVEVTEGEVWPDGDAPEFPSPSDVVEAMRACTGDVGSCVRDWLLIDRLSVRSSMNTEEVEWDGT